MARRRTFQMLVLGAVSLAVTACGGGDGGAASTEAQTGTRRSITVPSGSLGARLAQKPGPNVQIAFGAGDFAVGDNRVPFAVVRPNGELVQAPRAQLVVARSLADRPEQEVTAELVPLGPHSHPGQTKPHDHADITDLYVAQVRFARPGRYTLLAEPEGESIQAAAEIVVRRETKSPPLGSRAFPSDNPTLDDAPAERITTARPPDVELLRSSIKDALAAGAPFVVAFATPQFCESRTCGPTVEVVDAARRRFAGTNVRFIHVEVYRDNDPAKGVNRWMREWRLPSEPWVFLVDREGIIRAKFEGSVSAAELEQAVRDRLLR